MPDVAWIVAGAVFTLLEIGALAFWLQAELRTERTPSAPPTQEAPPVLRE